MDRHIQPTSLNKLSVQFVSQRIVERCKEIDERYITYDEDCSAVVKSLHYGFLDLNLPSTLYNKICEAAFTCHKELVSEVKDIRVLYGVLVNKNVTELTVGDKEEDGRSGIENVLPEMKNVVKLTLHDTISSEIVFAISETCSKLEHIILPCTSSEAFRSLIDGCPHLRLIGTCSCFSKVDIAYAIATLPNLVYITSNNTAAILESFQNDRQLNLVSVCERNATPSNILASVSICPHLRKLQLSPQSPDLDSINEIFDILASTKSLKVTDLVLEDFELANASVERFFIAKGHQLEDIQFYNCLVNGMHNFARFIGSRCRNVTYVIMSRFMAQIDACYEFHVPSDWVASFPRLWFICFTQNDSDNPGESFNEDYIQICEMFIVNSPILQRVVVSVECWRNGCPNAKDIERLFPVERLQMIHALVFLHVEMTKEMFEYFFTNTPSLTLFVYPINGVDEVASIYIQEMMIEYKRNNVNIEILAD